MKHINPVKTIKLKNKKVVFEDCSLRLNVISIFYDNQH